MCDVVPGELLLSHHESDPAGRSLIEDIEKGNIAHVRLLDSLRARMMRRGAAYEIPWDIYRVAIERGDELWKINFLHALYGEHSAAEARTAVRWPPPWYRGTVDGFCATPHNVYSLSALSFSSKHADYRRLIDANLLTGDGAGVRVGIVDSGVESGILPAVAENLASDVTPNDATDHFGHGTAVYDIVRDLAPQATFEIYKVVDQQGDPASEWDLLAAVLKAATRCQIINLSLVAGNATFACDICGRQSNASRSMILENVLTELLAANPNLVIVAAAGNDGANTLRFPANIDDLVAVGSVSSSGDISSFSNYQQSIRHHPHLCVAPGGGGTPAELVGTEGIHNLDCQGTSFAAPWVTGLIASALSTATVARSRIDVLHELSQAADRNGQGYTSETHGRGVARAFALP
jgi:Subtilase family